MELISKLKKMTVKSTLYAIFGIDDSSSEKIKTPFPARQMFILALCRLCEPVAFMSIFPYVYFMVESFNITTDTSKIALFAGLITSAFAFAEFLAGVVWGRLSDKYGRRPILLCGMAGTGISMIAFGFSTNLPAALIARALGGLLNGNIGVLQTTVAEVVTLEAHRPLGFSIMPVVWCVGSIFGAILGGALADPVKNYGWSKGTIFDAYPFLLPNIVCAALVVVCWVFGFFFLEESHSELRSEDSLPSRMNQWLSSLSRPRISLPNITCRKRDYTEETLTLMHEDDFPPDYRSAESSPHLVPVYAPHGLPPPAYQSVEATPRNSTSIDGHTPLLQLSNEEEQTAASHSVPDEDRIAASHRPHDEEQQTADTGKVGFAQLLTFQVILNYVSYGILAYHTISTEQLLPILFSLPPESNSAHLPFQFSGGLGWPTKKIGGILSTQGIIQVVVTLIIFPRLSKAIGSLWLFRLTTISYPLLYIVVPYITLLPEYPLRMLCVYLILIWKVSAQAFTFPSIQIMLAGQVQPTSLGTANGMAASSASLARAFGPTLSGLLQSAGLKIGVLGLPWWVNGGIALLGAVMSMFIVYVEPLPKKAADQNTHSDDTRDHVHGAGHTMVITELPNASLDTLQAIPTSPVLEHHPTERLRPNMKA